jgi:hypothetical protein
MITDRRETLGGFLAVLAGSTVPAYATNVLPAPLDWDLDVMRACARTRSRFAEAEYCNDYLHLFLEEMRVVLKDHGYWEPSVQMRMYEPDTMTYRMLKQWFNPTFRDPGLMFTPWGWGFSVDFPGPGGRLYHAAYWDGKFKVTETDKNANVDFD